MRINGESIYYRDLNAQIHAALTEGAEEIVLDNIRGQRYIGTGLNGGLRITINGVPGNDLGAFVNGAEIAVYGNAQDGVGNTMNSGKIVVHGNAGEVLGHSMRGGRIYILGHVSYRAGIHMKAYEDRFPVVVVGETAKDYLGEYMAGGLLVVLGLHSSAVSPVGEWVGTGMHGGEIYVRGKVKPYQLGQEVGIGTITDEDRDRLSDVLADYCRELGLPPMAFAQEEFVKLHPRSTRPYGRLYAY